MSAWTALILAAGKGTRLKSKHPKVLHELGGRPLVAHVIERALEVGASEVVVVVGHEADRVRATLEPSFPGRLRFAEQTEQLGTGHAARVGLEAAQGGSEQVLILSGDVPLLTAETLRRMTDGEEKVRFMTTRLSDPAGYGRVVRDESGRVSRVVEQKDGTPDELAIDEVNAGTYFVQTDFLAEVLSQLSADNAQREYYLTDIIARGAEIGSIAAVRVDDPMEVRGINNRIELAELQRVQWRRKADALMGDGVTIFDPDSVAIDEEVIIGRDTTIHPRAVLRGRTVVGEDCEIGVGAVLVDSELGAGVVVHPYSVVERARLGDAANAGPFARLRPGAELGPRAKVGNFVEVKNSVMGEGAKANHLTYLGDADVGAGANVGAGTITCNYDGIGKHRTLIEADVFVGSNATLVAPVAIGRAAYIAAGSTVTDAVPAGAVAFGRSRQTNKNDRAEALREKARQRKKEKSGG